MASVNSVTWASLKSTIAANSLKTSHVRISGSGYKVMAWDGPTVTWSEVTDPSDVTDFEANYKDRSDEETVQRVTFENTFNSPRNTGIGGTHPWVDSGTKIEEWTRNTVLNKTTFTNVYNFNGSGVFFMCLFNLEKKETYINFDFDGVNVINGLYLKDLDEGSVYNMHIHADSQYQMGIPIMRMEHEVYMVKLSNPISFSTNFTVSMMTKEDGKKMKAGYVEIFKES